MAAIDALEAPERIDLLITRAAFGRDTEWCFTRPHGKGEKAGVRVLFAARDEKREHTEGIGEFLPVPVTGAELVATVKRMLADETAARAHGRP